MADLTELVVVMDKSGSMGPMAADAVGGFNQFLKEQRALPDPAVLTLAFWLGAAHWGETLPCLPELCGTTHAKGRSRASASYAPRTPLDRDSPRPLRR